MRRQKFVSLIFGPLVFASFLTAGTLHFKNGDVKTSANVTDFLVDESRHFRNGVSHYLLAFNGPVGQDQLDLLAQAGATVIAFIPDNAVMIAANDSFLPTGLNIELATRLRPEQKRSPVTTLTSVVEFHSDVSSADARELLTQSGLTILEHPDLMPNHYLVLGPTDGLEQWDEVAYIFPASDDLLSGAHVYVCDSMGSGSFIVPMYVTSGHGWTAAGLNGITLQYTFSELTTKVAPAVTVQELTRALMEWPKHANVHFIPGLNPEGAQTVAIKFAEYDHGDGYPFDGPGGILAHTFYPVPTNPEPIAGDMHLDGSEDWHAGADTDIYTVALHEAGHSLGLGHTTQPGAIMYPYYRLGAEISNDDIAGIQSLYGPPTGWQPMPAAPDPPAATISLTIQTPAGSDLQTSAATEALAGTVVNATGSPEVTWQTDRNAAGAAAWPQDGSPGGASTWSIASVPLMTGANTITITATGGNHQTSTQSIQITRTATAAPPPAPPAPSGPDTIPPTISIASPASSIVQTNQSTITVTGSAADNAAVAKVTWQNTLSGSGNATGTNSWSANAIPLIQGTNTIILRAFDAAGNSSWRSLTVVRQ